MGIAWPPLSQHTSFGVPCVCAAACDCVPGARETFLSAHSSPHQDVISASEERLSPWCSLYFSHTSRYLTISDARSPLCLALSWNLRQAHIES
eukprot:686106-Pleurochrysis_carterae.AAC.1